MNMPSPSPALLHHLFPDAQSSRWLHYLTPQRHPPKFQLSKDVSTLKDRVLHTSQFGRFSLQIYSFISGLLGAFNSLGKLTRHTPENLGDRRQHTPCLSCQPQNTLSTEHPMGLLSSKHIWGPQTYTEPASQPHLRPHPLLPYAREPNKTASLAQGAPCPNRPRHASAHGAAMGNASDTTLLSAQGSP